MFQSLNTISIFKKVWKLQFKINKFNKVTKTTIILYKYFIACIALQYSSDKYENSVSQKVHCIECDKSR